MCKEDWKGVLGMGKYEKLKEKIFANPRKVNITIDEVKYLLLRKGFRLERVRGSHYQFSHPKLKEIITIASHNKRVLSAYIEKIKIAIEKLEN